MKNSMSPSQIKDKNKTQFIFHPIHEPVIINPDEALCYYEQGWLDHPATEEEIKAFSEMIKKQLKENEKKSADADAEIDAEKGNTGNEKDGSSEDANSNKKEQQKNKNKESKDEKQNAK